MIGYESITSLKDSDNSEKDLHVRSRAENRHRLPVSFDPPGSTAIIRV